ncbi:hypothetical protein LPJ66_000825 [Kickxella alabastrina]|uniref:Uncharacterized protein n=1 Tax=Kickxella alabastrina TaxID=61397 RepID=A0ACC1IV03_9FUNG|nr:hypothetical protein LPJ66_000825 [Kickxella alabastrina]
MPTTFSIKYVTTSIEPTTTSIKLATSTTTIIATTSTNSAAPESTKTPSAPADWCTEMLSQVNAIRAKAGKAALVLDDRMVLMAQKQSDYQFQIKKMTHDNVSGALTQRCTQVGVKWWGVAENVAAGQKDVTSVVTACKNSAGHYTNIIGNYNIVGFAINGIYWTQTFALI